MFGSSAFDASAAATFVALLAAAGASDLRSRRIPNSLVALLAVSGVGYAILELGGRAGMISALLGTGVGLLVWLPAYALRMVGAGDVKFFAAGSAWLGPRLALSAAVLSAILGGVLAISWVMWWRGRSARAAGRAVHVNAGGSALAEPGADLPVRDALPYGVAMAAGLGVIAWSPYVLR